MLLLDMNNPEILHLLNNYSDYTYITNPIVGFAYTLLGFLVKGLYMVSCALEDIFDKVFLVFGFMGNNSLFSGIHGVFITIGSVCLLGSILYLGYMYVLGYKVDLKNVIRNIVLTVVIFGLIPMLTSAVGTVVGDANRQIQSAQSSSAQATKPERMSLQPLKANIHDFLWLKAKGFPDWEASAEHNNLTDKKVARLNLGEIIPNDSKWYDNFLNLSEGDGEKDKLFQYEGNEDVTGKDEAFTKYHKIDKSFIKNLDNGWMRYKVYYIPLFLQQILLICLFAFTFLKLVKLATEMVIIQQYVPVIAFSDIHDGSKIKAVFQTIINSFIVMILVCANLRLFLIISQAVNEYLSQTSGSPMTKSMTYTFFQLGIFLAVVSGVGVVERLFGISTNMKSEALGAGIGVAAATNLMKSFAGKAGEIGNAAHENLTNNHNGEGSESPFNNTDNPNLDNSTSNQTKSENTNQENEEHQNNVNSNDQHNDSTEPSDNNADNPNLNIMNNEGTDNLDTPDNGNGEKGNDPSTNLDNPNLDADNPFEEPSPTLDNPNIAPDYSEEANKDNKSTEPSENLDNPNLTNDDEPTETPETQTNEDTKENIDNPNLDEEDSGEMKEQAHSQNKGLHNSNNDNVSGNDLLDESNRSSNLDEQSQNATNHNSTTSKHTNQKKRNHSKSTRNIIGDAMIRNQALDDEGQTKGKPLNEEPKEY